MAIKDKNTLKTYFETGDYPTQSNFEDLIDSLKHKNESLSNEELVKLANDLASIPNGFVEYYIYNEGDLSFDIVVNDTDELTLSDTNRQTKKIYFSSDAPYTIKAKEFPTEGLGTNEYYSMHCSLSNYNRVNRLFGSTLPTIPNGFEFGTLEGKRFNINIYKQNIGREINIVNTNIKFINNTNITVKYRAYSTYWGNLFKVTDSVTNHYNAWDRLYFQFAADMSNQSQTITCKTYNDDTNTLLMTGYLTAGQNHQGVWGGGTANAVRNIRIECDFQ